ncbi:hypothetical protein BU17DRAFT_69636 [Hysterangium stoloniferum]|nr:hypothetical protein BU17DRAFT_69636 [Hysterangium stoloniferum]
MLRLECGEVAGRLRFIKPGLEPEDILSKRRLEGQRPRAVASRLIPGTAFGTAVSGILFLEICTEMQGQIHDFCYISRSLRIYILTLNPSPVLIRLGGCAATPKICDIALAKDHHLTRSTYGTQRQEGLKKPDPTPDIGTWATLNIPDMPLLDGRLLVIPVGQLHNSG